MRPGPGLNVCKELKGPFAIGSLTFVGAQESIALPRLTTKDPDFLVSKFSVKWCCLIVKQGSLSLVWLVRPEEIAQFSYVLL